MVVTNNFGCQGSGTFQVSEGGTGLNPYPINIVTCQGSPVTLDAGNPGMTYQWSNGASTQTIAVSTAGSYQVTVTDPGGCSASFTNNVTFQPLPVVAFTAGDACMGQPSAMNNTSTVASGNIVNWQWNAGGQLSNAQQPSFTFAAAGSYTVSLTATSGFGCVDSASAFVQINPLPVAAFSASSVCEGQAMAFANQSTVSSGSINSWSWSFGDQQGATSSAPQHTYGNEGVYTTQLVVTTQAGCSDTVVQSVTVHPMPLADFVAQDVCEGETVSFVNTTLLNNGQVSDVSWDFGDGFTSTDTDPVHTYAAAGTYTVTLRIGSDQACEDTVAKNITIHPRPLAAFNAPPVCAGTTTVFADLSNVNGGTLSGWFWEFGDGAFSAAQQPTHQYASAGTYSALLVATSNRGCTDSATQVVVVNTMPQAGFSTAGTCFGTPVQFNDSSSSGSTAISSWSWNFGDGGSASQQDPQHSYAASGTYAVQLIVNTAQGCSDTLQQSINIFPVPSANFSANNVCLNGPTSFVDQSQISGGGTFSYLWNFGDNTSATDPQPQHNYTSAGTYTVTMTVTSPFGCSDAHTASVTVYPLPVADFTAGSVCLNTPVQLIDQSTVATGAVSGWSWTLGDGTVSTAQNPTHFYANPGFYTVTLEVSSAEGCRASVLDSVEIYAPPSPQPVLPNGCVGANISFADTSSGAGNTIVSWSWTLGNGSSASQATGTTLYTAPGTYPVLLTTENTNGCRATASTNVVISPLPVAGFTSGTACLNTPVQFSNTSTVGSGSISGYSWNFGDGSGTSGAANPSYVFSQTGTYTVTLIAVSNDGCADTVSAQVVVNPLPVPSFSDLNGAGCGPLLVSFRDSSFISSGNVTAWSWDFGDGGSSTLQNPTHTYAVSGNYPVTLTVTSDSGCSNSITQNNAVTVYPGPDAAFEPEPALQNILDPNFSFINLSSGALTYAWTFGDGGSSTLFEPLYTYRDTGDYTVTLWVTNAYGCRDSVSHPVRVDPIFSFYVPNAFTPNGDGNNEGFNVSGEYIADVELSIFNRWGEQIFFSAGRNNAPWDGSVAGASMPAQEGVYVFQVRVTDVWGQIHEKVGHVSLVR